MRVGFAGLGRMGGPMARNLSRAGCDLTLWNRSPDKARALAKDIGAAVAETPAALSGASDVVIAMLADDVSSQAVHMGREGLFSVAGPSHFVEMGTLSPHHVAELSAAAPASARVVDAPVSGATQAAADAELLIMAGCTEAEADPLRRVFDALGRQTLCLGALGRGAIMKLAVNSLIHGLNQTMAEAMTLAEAAGIDSAAAYDVIEASAAAAPMLKYRRQLYLDEAHQAVSFTVALARKDMDLTAALADALGTAMPQGRETLRLLRAAEADGHAGRDMASMLDYMRKERR